MAETTEQIDRNRSRVDPLMNWLIDFCCQFCSHSFAHSTHTLWSTMGHWFFLLLPLCTLLISLARRDIYSLENWRINSTHTFLAPSPFFCSDGARLLLLSPIRSQTTIILLQLQSDGIIGHAIATAAATATSSSASALALLYLCVSLLSSII